MLTTLRKVLIKLESATSPDVLQHVRKIEAKMASLDEVSWRQKEADDADDIKELMGFFGL